MATANDRAVLQSIFHPNTPFGEISAEDETEQMQEEGELEGRVGMHQSASLLW